MSTQERTTSSAYMHWSKTQVHTKYNLGISGIAHYPLSALGVSANDLEITGDSYYGYAPLVAAIARKEGVTTDRVFTTLGTSMANHLVMAALLTPGDEVLVEHPTYELLLATAGYFGAVVRRFARRFEEKFQIDPEDLRLSARTKLVVLTNLHNPSSALLERGVLEAVGRQARSVGARVLVDEVYLDAASDFSPVSAAQLGEEFIVTNSLTKVYGLSGLRCGWVIGDPAFIERLWRLNDLFNVIPSHPAELLSVVAFGTLGAILKRTQSILTPNRELLRSFLAGRGELATFVPDWGNVVFPRLTRGTVEGLCAILRDKYETLVVPGTFFGMPEHFRLGLGAEQELFREGLKRLGLALDEFGPATPGGGSKAVRSVV